MCIIYTWASLMAQIVKNLQCRRDGFDPWVGKIPWSRKWHPTTVFFPVKFRGQRNLVGYSPWSSKELHTTEQLNDNNKYTHTYICIYIHIYIYIHTHTYTYIYIYIHTHIYTYMYISVYMYIQLLEKAMAPHSSTLAWKIPWTEEPGRLQSMGLLRVGHDWATLFSLFTFMHWRRKWQPTPVFLPGESQGRGSLVGCCLWGRTESDTSEVT